MAVAIKSFTRADEIDNGIVGSSDDRAVAYWAELTEVVGDENSDEGDSLILSHAEATVPILWDGMARSSFSIQQRTPTKFLVEASYSRSKPSSTGQWSFDVTAQTQRTYSAISQTKFGASAPNHGVALNVVDDNGQLRVEGFDTYVPSVTMEWNRTSPGSLFSAAYIDTIAQLVGTINNATFKGIPVGELMFLGTRGRIASSGESEISYQFQRRRTPTLPLTIGGITIPSGTTVYGWDVIWAQWRTSVDGSVNDMAAGAKGVYVARVFPLTNFGLLGL